jgi:hypothetical protein
MGGELVVNQEDGAHYLLLTSGDKVRATSYAES